MVKSKVVKNSQLYPWCPTFKHSLIWPSMKKLLNLPLLYRNTYLRQCTSYTKQEKLIPLAGWPEMWGWDWPDHLSDRAGPAFSWPLEWAEPSTCAGNGSVCQEHLDWQNTISYVKSRYHQGLIIWACEKHYQIWQSHFMSVMHFCSVVLTLDWNCVRKTHMTLSKQWNDTCHEHEAFFINVFDCCHEVPLTMWH